MLILPLLLYTYNYCSSYSGYYYYCCYLIIIVLLFVIITATLLTLLSTPCRILELGEIWLENICAH